LKKANEYYVLAAIIVIAAILHFHNLGKPALHTDEAEVYLAAQNIFDSGVPKGFYRVPFYENAYLYSSNSSMYEFAPTNYYKTELVLRKGWVTYYIVAFFSLIGKDEFLLRFPFALIGLISIFVFYKLGELLFNKRTALIASFFYAVSPSLLFYDRMVRYYSPMILFILLSTYFFLKAYKSGDKKDYFFGTGALVLLFYTNILIFASFLTVIVLFGLIRRVKINKTIIQSALILVITTVPWILATRFLNKITGEPSHNFFALKPGFIFQTITAGISAQGLLYIFLWVSAMVLLLNVLMRSKTPKVILWKEEETNKFLLLYIGVMIIIPLILSPPTSFEEKLFLSLTPFFLILIAKMFDSILDISKNNFFKYVVFTIIILVSFVNVGSVFGYESHDAISAKKIFSLEKDVVFEEIDQLIRDHTSNNPLILTTSDHFPLMFYTNFSVQTIWAVRESFIDNYDGELVIIEKGFVEGTCNFFYQYINPFERCGNNKNYLNKVVDCEEFVVGKDTTIYFCKEKKRFLGGNQGLFFSDFPKGSPPDFIWDLEPFSVALDVENWGEIDVDDLKVAFTGDFAGREFDRTQDFFVFNKTILGKKRIDGNTVQSKEQFELGTLTFNHKLLNKNQYINASVMMCYSYKTIIRVDVCKDSLDLCGLDVSGAPVQIGNIAHQELDLNFSIHNSAEGTIGDVDACGEENSTKRIKVTSDSFKCEPLKNSFNCQGIENRLKKDESYYITISYDYQQEFKKGILLRSKEKNSYDYELSRKNN